MNHSNFISASMYRQIVALLLAFPLCASAQTLTQLKYNHPKLVVDLGVGLWAWPIPWDVNGDGKTDLLVSCPDKPSNGVWYFENSGELDRNRLPIFHPARKISGTKHYVMPSYVGDTLRVLAPGVEYINFARTGIENPVKLPVAANFYSTAGKQPRGPRVRHNQWRYVDYDGDGRLDLITGIEDWSFYGWDDAYNAKGDWTNGPLHGYVILHRNIGKNGMTRYAEPVKVEACGKPIDTFGCPSPNFADFDGDGDLDLICGEFLDGLTYYHNGGTRKEPQYLAGVRLRDVTGKPIKMDLQMIVPVAFDWNKDTFVDLIVGDEDGRVALVEHTGKFHTDGSPIFKQPVYFSQFADTLKCGALATPVGVDWDGDGDIDIVSGNTAGYIEFFENLSGKGVAEPRWAAPIRLEVDGKPFRVQAGANGSIQGPAEAKWGYTCFSVADWDGDGLPDIVLNSILGEVVWLRNTGTKKNPRLAAPQPVLVEWEGKQPSLAWGWRRPQGKALLTQWRTTPVVFDFTGDGLADLAMLDHEGYFVLFERAKRGDQLVLLSPRRVFGDEQGKPLRFNSRTAGASGRRKLSVTDWDGDGQCDLLLNSSNADLYRGLGKKNGMWLFARPRTLARQNIEGHDVSPTVVDFNGDNIPDFLGGAEDGRMYFLLNPRTK
ncbi:MAG: VCBS repeat-containing protein [Gemmataceae bacterium]